MPTLYAYFRVDPHDLDATCPRCRARLRRPPAGGEVTCSDCGERMEFEIPEILRRAREAFEQYLESLSDRPERSVMCGDIADANRAMEDRAQFAEIWRDISRDDWFVTTIGAWGDGGDCAATLGRLLRVRAQVHLLKRNGRAIVLEPGSAGADAFQEIESSLNCTIRDRVRANRAAKARERDDPRNQFPGYGFKYERDRRTGQLKRVPDEEQRALMRRLIDLRDAGYTWRDIHDLLAAEGVRSPRGTPWVERSLQRLHAAGVRLFAEDATASSEKTLPSTPESS